MRKDDRAINQSSLKIFSVMHNFYLITIDCNIRGEKRIWYVTK